MNNLKRFLALMLAMCMMLTAVPFGAFATESTEAPDSDVEALADDGIATASVTLGTKPANGEMSGEPFNDEASYTGSTTGHTNYRIPGMVMLNDGTLVASADIRYDYEYDGGGSDIVVSRSEDDGATWNYSVVAYLGDQGNVHAKNASTMMDPVLITDGTNLYLLYDLFPAGYSLGGGSNTTYAFSATGTGFDSQNRLLLSDAYNSTNCGYYLENGKIYATDGTEQAGYTVDAWFNVYLNNTYVSNLFFAESPFYAYPTSYACIQKSVDGGESWSDPEMLKTKHEGTAWQVLGPGSGIVTSSGELAFTVYNAGGSISLVHGTPGDWTTVRTSEATNESSVVELSDGTIRAFVKNSSNQITYVDFTKSGDSYTAGSAVSTGITNTGWCMISSMVYSKKIDGKEVILVCCPASSALRRYGNVFAFTVDPTTKAMTKVGSYQITTPYSDQFFAYSDMAELEDGTIALLYEDGCRTYSAAPWNGSAAGSGYSHIALTNVDPVEDLGLTFDAEDGVQKITLAEGETTEIKLNQNIGSGSQSGTAADVSWVGETVTTKYPYAQLGTTASFDGSLIDLSKCLYTFTKDGDLWQISGNADGTTVHIDAYGHGGYPNRSAYITSLYLTNGSNGGIKFHEEASNKFLHFWDNDDSKLYWDQCSNDGCTGHNLRVYKLADTTSTTALGGYFTQVTDVADLESGEKYLIVGHTNSGGDYAMHPSTVVGSTQAQKYNHLAKVTGNFGEYTEETTTITITGKTAGTTTVDIGGTTYTITVKSDAKEITLDVGESYTDTINGSAYTTDDVEIVDNTIVSINVEGTSVVGSKELVEITKPADLVVGKQYLIYNIREGGLLTNEPITDNYWNGSNYTGLKIEGAASEDSTELWTYTANSGFTQDGKYLTFGDKSAGTTETETSLTLDYTANSGWRIMYNNLYLTDLWGNNMNGMYGFNDGNASTATDGGNYYRFYEIVETPGESSTEVTFTGLKIGTTTAQVGHVKYTITVEGDTRDLALKVGESYTDTINGVGYTIDNVTTWPNDAVAKLNSVTSTGAQLVPVTQIESGKHYLIVNAQTGDVLTNTAVSATGSWENKPGLETTGKAATDSTELWAITASGNGYTIVQDNQYLTASGFYAVMSDTEAALTLNYTESGWTIMDNTTCASLSGHDQADYYLSDNVGNGYDEAALGTSAKSDYCYWNIYEIDAAGSTNVSFTGVTTGETKAVIGGVTYNITVAEDIRDIKLHKGQTKTFYIDGSHYTTGTIKDSSIAVLNSVVPGDAKLVLVSEIVSGEQYLIVNSQTGEVLTDTAITLTGDAGEKSALVTEGTASVDNAELWTITGDAITGYTVSQGDKYLVIAGYHAAMSTTATNLKLTKSNSGWMICDKTTWSSLGHNQADYYLRNGIADANYTTDAMGSSITSSYSYWDIYKIDTTPVTEVTFTGVKEGNTTATVGHVTFNITVDNVTEGNIADFNNIVGVDSYTDGNANATYRSDLDMAGKKITSLRITEGASFHLGVDVTGYDSVTWTAADTDIATVDANGNVTAVKTGETVVTATVIKDGVMESISIPVTVVPSMVEGYTSSQISPIFYYIEEIETTDPYYTMFLSTENTTGPVDGHKFIMVSEGEVIWYERPTDSAFAWVWTADPWEGTALTYMASTGSVAEYYPLKTPADDGDTLGSGTVDGVEYYKGNNAYNNIVSVGNDDGASWQSALDTLLEEAIVIGKNVWPNYGCDGAMSNTRWDHDGVPTLVTSMTFISDPMPQIDKTVNGILPVTRLQKDFRRYENGMVATVGEYVYFDITITVERPDAWVKDSSGNDTTTGAITYSNALLTDYALDGAYFYTKDLDMADSADGKTLDGIIAEENQVQLQDITNALNAPWAEDETVRTLNYYLIYVIVEDDIPKFNITNTANLAWNYQSVYSTGKLSGAADAQASITVVGSTMENVVIDFGQSFEYTGLTAEHLKYVHTGTYNTTYGVVVVTGIGDEKENASGKYYDNYKVIYTPTSILRGPDAVQLMGSYIDQDDTNTIENGTKIEKAINGFVVYPATSVYYEEGFMFDYQNDDATSNTQWVTTNSEKATVCQTFEKLSKKALVNQAVTYVSDKQHSYGYDPIYDAVDASKITQSTATKAGAATTFTFTGTGFDLYANCTEETGYVSVQIKDAAGKAVKLYTVNTKVGEATAAEIKDSTDGQSGSMYSLPIVSEQGLAHGTYTVVIRKIMTGAVNIDGIRIYNTFDESPYQAANSNAESPFAIDLEDAPEFYQLRDYVLSAMDLNKIENSQYGSVAEMAEQVYNQISGDTEEPTAVVLAKGAYNSDVQNLLENGPKNEIYLHAGETLVFNVSTKRAMQIGLKAPAGATSYTITGAGNGIGGDLSSTVDMFYALNNTIGTETTYTITITNTGSEVLSVTNLKICDDPNAALVPLTAENIKSALVTMGYGVAENATTGASYDSVADALAAAKEGETVKLLADCTESTVMVTPGITLDLNGFKLTASNAVAFDSAHVIDNVGSGCVVIGSNDLVLDENNAMIPVYNGEGYVFTKAGFSLRQDTAYTGDGIKVNALACPVRMAVVELLKDGGTDNNIEIMIRLTWDSADGTGSQEFKFTDEVVASVYSSNKGTWSAYDKMFSMVVTGFENIQNLKACVVVASGTDVEYVSSTSVNIT